MKAILSLFFASAIAFASGHHGPEDSEHCHCGVFATTHEGLVEMDSFPHHHIDDCNEETCKTVCRQAWDEMMGTEGLNTATKGGITMGQRLCNNIKGNGYRFFDAHKVYGYSSVCHGPLLYDGLESIQHLCCSDGLYKQCAAGTHFH